LLTVRERDEDLIEKSIACSESVVECCIWS